MVLVLVDGSSFKEIFHNSFIQTEAMDDIMTETMEAIVIETMKDSIGFGTTQNQDSIAIMVVSTTRVIEDSMALLEII